MAVCEHCGSRVPIANVCPHCCLSHGTEWITKAEKSRKVRSIVVCSIVVVMMIFYNVEQYRLHNITKCEVELEAKYKHNPYSYKTDHYRIEQICKSKF